MAKFPQEPMTQVCWPSRITQERASQPAEEGHLPEAKSTSKVTAQANWVACATSTRGLSARGEGRMGLQRLALYRDWVS